MKYLLVISFLILGCEEEKKVHSQKENEASWIHYYKDNRTDLCFAGDGKNSKEGESHLTHDHSHLTSVPCTDTVERLLEPWPDYNL